MNNDIQKLNYDFEVKPKHESETKQPTFLGLTPADILRMFEERGEIVTYSYLAILKGREAHPLAPAPLSPVMEIKREYKAWLQAGRKL